MARVDARRVAILSATAGLSFSLLWCTSFAGLVQPDEAGTSPRDGSVPTTDGPVTPGEGGDGSSSGSSGDPCKAAADYRNAVIADKPLAYFRFDNDGGTTTRDESGGTSVCTAGSSVVSATGAHPCSAGIELIDAAGSYLGCNGPFGFPGKAPFSIEGWIFPLAIDDHARHIATNQTSSFRAGYDLYVQDGSLGKKLAFELFAAGTGQCTGLATLVEGRWSYILATYDGNEVTVRVNDAPAEKSSCNNGPGAGLQLTLGANTGKDEHFVGKMDEMAIYSFVLSKAQADAHFALGPRL